MEYFDAIKYITEPRWQQSRLGLERIEELLTRLDDPQEELSFVHVAGTNGKGSVSTYLASILQQADYKTGVLSSPSISNFTDQIKIDGNNISSEQLCAVAWDVKQEAEAMEDHPTEFELTTAVAFLYFARMACDIVVVEVGMGGRLDSTNVIAAPEVSVLTMIGLDHQEYLGDTLEEIAAEKAGIVKPGSPVVSWPQESMAKKVIEKVVLQQWSTLVFPDFDKLVMKAASLRPEEGQAFSYRQYQDLSTIMMGTYQPYNAALAIESIEVLRGQGWSVSEKAVRQGIREAYIPGRFEILATDPYFIIDGAHNVEGARVLRESLERYFPGRKITFIVGVLEDKNYKALIEEIYPLGEAFVVIQPPSPRSLSNVELAKAIQTVGEELSDQAISPEIYAANSVSDAIQHVQCLADKNDIICACGSLYSIASIKEAIDAL